MLLEGNVGVRASRSLKNFETFIFLFFSLYLCFYIAIEILEVLKRQYAINLG
jgi:hypothetical protein